MYGESMTFYQWKTSLLRLLAVALLAAATSAAHAASEQQATYQDMPVGFTAEGHPFIGEPNAPVTLEEWSDYLCPFSAIPALSG
jgi:protein-disulfide isomerase